MNPSPRKFLGDIGDGEFEILFLTKDDLEGALNVVKQSIFLKEALCVATEIHHPEAEGARDDLLELCRNIVNFGVSLIAKHKSTNEVVGVALNFIHVAVDPGKDSYIQKFRKYHCHSPNSIALLDLMLELDEVYDFFENFKIDCFMEVMFLATLPKFEGRKIAKSLSKSTILLARDLHEGVGIEHICDEFRGKRIMAVTGIMTAFASQKIATEIGVQLVKEVPFSQFSINGISCSERLGPTYPPNMHFTAVNFNI